MNSRAIAVGTATILVLVWSTIEASTPPAQWSGWSLDIDNKRCELLNEFRARPDNPDSNRDFLAGTPFEYVRLRIVAETSSRTANPSHIGKVMLAIHIKSREDLELPDRMVLVNFGGAETSSVEWKDRPPGDTLIERYAAFWFMGSDTEGLIFRLTQGETLPLTFASNSGDRISTEFTAWRAERFPAWVAAVKACAQANQE